MYDLSGQLSPAALQAAWSEIVRLHRVLRTTFSVDAGQPVQIAAPEAPLPLPFVDLGGIPARRREETAQDLAQRQADRPFDLERGPLLRVLLVRLEARRHWLLLNFHHIVCDARSLELLLQELAGVYAATLAGTRTARPQPELQYADFAHWEMERLEALGAHLPYWQERLTGMTELRLPFDRPRPAVQSFRGARCLVPLGADLDRVGVLARQLLATRFTLLLAIFAAFLRRITGQEDLPVGSPFSGRACPGTEDMIGFFVQTLVLRLDAAGDPGLAELVRRVFVSVAEAQAHQELPFDLLVRALRPERTLSHNPLFQVMFAAVPASAKGLALPGLAVRRIPIAASMARFDLTLEILEGEVETGAAVAIEYSTELFARPTIQRLADGFRCLLAACLDNPQRPLSELPLLEPAELQQVLVEWNDRGAEKTPASGGGGSEACVQDLFLRQAERTPEAEALIAGTERITYRELARLAHHLARRLRTLGVEPEVPVGIFAERSSEMVVGLLGTLLAGGAYVPLDPDYPQERLAFLLEDAAMPLVLAQSSLLARLPASGARVVCLEEALAAADREAERESIPPPSVASASNLAYAIYTSGSTGRPKGVAVTHRSAVARLRWARQAFRPEELAGVLASTSICFDVSVFELFAPLAWGGKLILSRNVLDLPRLPARGEVVTMCTVPSAMAELVDTGTLPPSVRTVNLAGEALHRALVERLYENPGVMRVLNLYGPSEDTTYSTLGVAAPRSQGEPTIGRPLPGTRAYVLDSRLALLPRGAVGELYLGGAGQARGYLGRPELTAERFVPDPLSSRPGQRLYRTGDLVRHRLDGELEFLGRTDHQVKVRGFRIELGEIESALCGIEGVREAVAAVGEAAGGMVLAAFFVADPAGPGGEELRTALRARLPEPMVPGRFVRLAALPRTPNGKIDRAALSALHLGRQERKNRRPGSPLEELIAEVWSAVLGCGGGIGAEEDFFELGGHSLLAMRVLARLRASLGIEIGVRQLFELRTVSGLAAWIERVQWGGSRPVTPPLRPVVRTSPVPLSFAQERLWFLDHLDPQSPVYNLPVAWRLEGDLSVPALGAALAEVMRRHEALRTVFDNSLGVPVQAVLPAAAAPLPVVDLRGLPEALRASEVRRLAVAEGCRPFDLQRGPLLRRMLVAYGKREHVLVLGMHHIVSDGWSIGILWGELAALYGAALAGEPAALPELPVQYPDYAVWQREWLRGEALEVLLGHWRERLAGAATMDLPTDRPRPVVRSLRGGIVRFEVPEETVRSLAGLGRRTGTTLFMVLLAAFQTLLHRLTGEEDVVVGTPVAGRDRVELEPLIGFFVNTLPLRSRLSGGAPFCELLGQVREATLQAFAHQDLPFEKLVEELQPLRDLTRTPLFQAMFAFQNTPGAASEMPGLSLSQLPVETGVSRFDLTLVVSQPGGELGGLLEYNTDLFDSATVQRLANHLRALLAALVVDADRPLSGLPVLSESARHQLELEWNDMVTGTSGGERIDRWLAEQALRTPEAAALRCAGREWSYRALDGWAGRLAGRLRRLGVGPETRVGVCLERSPELIGSVVGILKAGGAYVPLDPAYPEDRIAFLLADSGAKLVVTDEHLARRLPGDLLALRIDRDLGDGGGAAPEPDLCGAHLAYVIYTSGSTGEPKGVMVSQRSMVNLAHAFRDFLELAPGDRFLMVPSVSFDASVGDIFPALMSGATLVLDPNPGELSGRDLQALCEREEITVLDIPAALWQTWVEDMERRQVRAALPALRKILVGGESLPLNRLETWNRLTGGKATLIGPYGPTEATVCSTLFALAEGARSLEILPISLSRLPIGRPIGNLRIHLLDHDLHPVAIGRPGEVYIGGAGLARGYLGRPGSTAEKFVPDPFGWDPGGRLYRSGDLASRLPAGDLLFLGRVDHQIKVRGFRVEPGEIEAALLKHPQVRQGVVVARDDERGQKSLVAYVVPGGGGALSPGEIRSFLKACLPAYAVPSAFVCLDELPLNPHGKIDYRGLPAPGQSAPGAEISTDLQTPAEERLAEIWSGVLGIGAVGVHDDFFELGGHSLLAVQLVTRIGESFAVELPLRTVFDHPTIAGLAELLERDRHEESKDERRARLLAMVSALSTEEVEELLAGA